ncbi:MAG: helix-turn-helix domain-containing protein [Nitrospiraceae bacterium]|nr:helix-turn-helix domain-containing protein [Nitrospiraceae bacterium]
MGAVQRIYTVKEVAAVLRVRPFTVREMFRTGRLSGFKVGKAWRITEDALEADIAAMRGMGAAPRTVPPAGQPPGASVEPVGLARVPESPAAAGAAVGAVGRLLVFSDMPAQEVYLDGVHRGPTTLDIMNVPVGEHVLLVGDVSGRILVEGGGQMRVCLSDGQLEVIAHSAPRAAPEPQAGEPQRRRLSVRVENRTAFAGAIEVVVASEDAELAGSVFPDGLVEADAALLTLAGEIKAGETAIVFDDVITVAAGTRLRFAVPPQEGFKGAGEQFASVNSDTAVSIILERGGLFRSKDSVRFEVARV